MFEYAGCSVVGLAVFELFHKIVNSGSEVPFIWEAKRYKTIWNVEYFAVEFTNCEFSA